jgi:hypothetical protein
MGTEKASWRLFEPSHLLNLPASCRFDTTDGFEQHLEMTHHHSVKCNRSFRTSEIPTNEAQAQEFDTKYLSTMAPRAGYLAPEVTMRLPPLQVFCGSRGGMAERNMEIAVRYSLCIVGATVTWPPIHQKPNSIKLARWCEVVERGCASSIEWNGVDLSTA